MRLIGDNTANRLFGTDFDDFIAGRGGDDFIFGGRGNDILRGSRGNDTIEGGSGNDVISGGYGNDFLHGGSGRDTIYAGPGRNTINTLDNEADTVWLGSGGPGLAPTKAGSANVYADDKDFIGAAGGRVDPSDPFSGRVLVHVYGDGVPASREIDEMEFWMVWRQNGLTRLHIDVEDDRNITVTHNSGGVLRAHDGDTRFKITFWGDRSPLTEHQIDDLFV